MTKLKLPSWKMTVLLLLSSCAAQIHDFPVCSPYPKIGGASCDNFLPPHHPVRLNALQWQAQIDAWAKKGWALECTNSLAIAQNKAELEKFCSVYSCTVAQQEEINRITSNMDHSLRVGRGAMEVSQ